MSFSVDLVNLLLYCTQQLGVMLGVGSETIVVILFFLAMRNGSIEPKEEQFGRAVHRVLRWGLGIIIVSGLIITLMHLSSGAEIIVFSPAFILKWVLIWLVVGAELWRGGRVFGSIGQEGVIAATWYALFILHILAPVAVWIDLLVLWAIWSAGFVLCFITVAHAMHIRNIPAAQKPKPIPVQEKKPQKVFVAPPPPEPKPFPKPVPPPPAPKPTPPPPIPIPKLVLPPPPPPPVVHAPLPALAENTLPMLQERAAPAPRKPEPVTMAVPKKPAQPVSAVPKKPLDQMPIPTKPKDANAPKEYPDMPAIRVMPKTPEELDKSRRSSDEVGIPTNASGQTSA